MRGFWEFIVCNFTGELRYQNFRMTCSTFDKLCDGKGPLVVPVASCPTDKSIV